MILITDPSNRLLFGLGIVGVMYTFILYFFMVAGIAWGLQNRGSNGLMILLALLSIAYFVLIPGASGQARFRIPIEPFLAYISGFGWISIKSFAQSKLHAKRVPKV